MHHSCTTRPARLAWDQQGTWLDAQLPQDCFPHTPTVTDAGPLEPMRAAAGQALASDAPVSFLSPSGVESDWWTLQQQRLAAHASMAASPTSPSLGFSSAAGSMHHRAEGALTNAAADGGKGVLDAAMVDIPGGVRAAASFGRRHADEAVRAAAAQSTGAGHGVHLVEEACPAGQGPSIIEQAKRLIDQSGGGDASQPDEPRFKRCVLPHTTSPGLPSPARPRALQGSCPALTASGLVVGTQWLPTQRARLSLYCICEREHSARLGLCPCWHMI